jgi:hypothetical protein
VGFTTMNSKRCHNLTAASCGVLNPTANKDSVAYKSIKERKNGQGDSFIDKDEYFCFTFYEKDVQQPLPGLEEPFDRILPTDRIAIIGWPKNVYEIIQKLQLKKNLKQKNQKSIK